MYDLFFTEQKGSINGHTIDFNFGKDKFDLKSIHNSSLKTANEEYKIYFEIPFSNSNESAKETIEKKANDLKLTIEQLLQFKKKNIITRFLKGYSHQEGILKYFESKIKDQFSYMPNLIFKTKNSEGKTIEEIDQIYLLNLNNKTLSINDFDVFYYADFSQNPCDYKIITEGKPLELETDNLYFIEIKKSSARLKKSYDDVKNIKLEKIISSNSSRYKRNQLTDVGNTLLTANNFAALIEEITDRNYTINILYIIDDEYDLEMIKTFNDCLQRDKEVMDDSYTFKIKLIYTQPDLALKHFIEENSKKNYGNYEFE